MKRHNVNLHITKKKAIIITASFSVLASLILVFTLLSMNTMLGQLHSLCQSTYVFSALSQSPSTQDCYYQINAGISMATSPDAKSSLNADILMQTEEANYTGIVSWNANILERYELALTSSLARAYSVQIGDKLYSKHVVDGNVVTYTVKQILSEGTSIREKGQNSSNGIIIMGYDDLYVSNISHSALIYVNDNVEDVSMSVTGTLENILYRSDEIASAVLHLIPYCILFLGLAVASSICFVNFLSKEVKQNFIRLKIMGARSKDLDHSYSCLIYQSGIVALVMSTLLTMIVAAAMKSCCLGIVFSIVLGIIQILTILWLARIMKRRLWRA